MDFQRQTVRWMQDQEAAPRGLNGTFWEERRWGDAPPTHQIKQEEGKSARAAAGGRGGSSGSAGGDVRRMMPEEMSGGSYWYFPLAGELRLTEPPLSRGGMLSEEMGLGKTLEILALISADASAGAPGSGPASIASSAGAAAPIASSATLIVVPPPLLRQWEAEVAKCVRPGTLKLQIYEGRLKGSRNAEDEIRACELAKADVVLATYPQLQGPGGKILSRVGWRRVVLDECQMVGPPRRQLTRSCTTHRALRPCTAPYALRLGLCT
jgi:E3 ubiquitin-protein ligase SHPRH